MPQGHSDRLQHKSARRIDSKVRPSSVIVHSTQSGHGTDHTRNLGGHTATGPPTLWSMSESFNPWKAWMTLTVVLAARASSVLQNKCSLQVICQTSHRLPQCFTAHLSRYFKSGLPRPSTEDVSLYDTAHPHRGGHSLGSAFWRQCFDGFKSADSLRAGSKVWSAKSYTPRPSSHSSSSFSSGTDSLQHILGLWERRHLTQATSSSTASPTILLPRQLWSEGAPLFPHAARSLIGHLSGSLCPHLPQVFLDFPSCWKVREFPGLLGLRKLDGNRAS